MDFRNDWADRAKSFLESNRAEPIHLVGVGNPIRGDDSVGIYIASHLRKKFGSRPSKRIRIHPPLTPEFLFPKIDLTKGSLIIFDAVEQDSPPGTIVFANVEDTKFGYFATHNIPLKLIPNISDKTGKIFVLGIQPENIDIGEDLSKVVSDSANYVIAKLEPIIGGTLLNVC